MSRVSPLHVSNQFLALEEDGDDPEDVVGNSLDFVSVCPLGESGHMENESPEACEEVDEGEEEASRAKAAQACGTTRGPERGDDGKGHSSG